MTAETTPAQPATPAGLISRSHLGIEPFSLHRPDSLTDAASMIAAGAWAHAGGIDVAQRLRDGETTPALVPPGPSGRGTGNGEAPGALVPLCRPGRGTADGMDVLDEISLRDGALFIGAAVTHARIETDRLVRTHRPDLADAWRTLGNVRIRSTGTVGGNLMAFDAGYDAAPILAAAGAALVFMEPDGTELRTRVAARPRDRLLVGCEIPLTGRVVYDRSLKPVASVAVGEGCLAIGCAFAEIKVLPVGAADPDAALAALGELDDPTCDVFASAGYRRRIIEVLVDRCLRAHAAGRSAGPERGDIPSMTDPPRNDAVPAGRPALSTPDGTIDDSIDGTTDDSTDDSIDIAMRLNGAPFPITAPASEMLVDTIRTRAGLGGTRVGCDQAVCGACTVVIDGSPTASCSTFAWQTEGREVLTIESGRMAANHDEADGPAAVLPVVQRAFAARSAFQCGYCTPGLILTASALLARHPDPDRTTICDWLDSNVCRCTGYLMVIEAVEAAAAALRSAPDTAPDTAP